MSRFLQNSLKIKNKGGKTAWLQERLKINMEQNGYMENVAVLQKPPFDKPISFLKLFDAKTRTALMKAINDVRENAVTVAG